MKTRVIHSPAFVEDAVIIITESAREAIQARGIFRLCLCGGNTPRPVYAKLAQSKDIPWERVQITFGDERCVPPEDAQSNFKMAKESLLDSVPIPAGNVFRIRGELPPEQAAQDYQDKLRQVASRFGETRYLHDLLLLGLGEDGHSASLFPETAALEETERDVVANFVPKFGTHRITLTYPLLNAAREICFLINDPSKAGVIDAIVAGGSSFPAGKVAPSSGRLTWLLGF